MNVNVPTTFASIVYIYYYFILCVGSFDCMHVCAFRGHWIPWNWVEGMFVSSMWVLPL